MDGSTAQQRFVRALVGVVAASALVYPMLFCAVQLVFAQLLAVDVLATVLWLSVAVVCSVALVAALRWGAARRIRSYWLLLGLAPPAAYELWLVWPAITA
jgi:hypothetical protein